MKVVFSPIAAKAAVRLPVDVSRAMLDELKRVAADPLGDHPWAKRLTDHPGFRLRQGDWRAIYRLDHAKGELIVDRIAKRDEVYR